MSASVLPIGIWGGSGAAVRRGPVDRPQARLTKPVPSERQQCSYPRSERTGDRGMKEEWTPGRSACPWIGTFPRYLWRYTASQRSVGARRRLRERSWRAAHPRPAAETHWPQTDGCLTGGGQSAGYRGMRGCQDPHRWLWRQYLLPLCRT